MDIMKRLWALFLLPPTLLGIWYLPSDWAASTSEDVARPWRDMLALLSRETLLWALCLFLSAWLIWTEVRPFWRARFGKPKFPPRHATILEELANTLAEVHQITLNAPRGIARISLSDMQRHNDKLEDARTKAGQLINQIMYDRPTADSARDFLRMCLHLHDDLTHSGDHGQRRREIKRVSPPLFSALHAGKSVNRAAIPWPQWILGTEPKKRP